MAVHFFAHPALITQFVTETNEERKLLICARATRGCFELWRATPGTHFTLLASHKHTQNLHVPKATDCRFLTTKPTNPLKSLIILSLLTMLPTDNAKRLLLQQHLLNNRLAQQLSAPATNEMHLQTPPIAVSTVTTSPLSSIHSVSGLGRDNGAGLQTSQESNIFQYLLAADQERRLKRRLSEMQQLRLVDLHQQIQFQRQQQHQSRLFQSHLGRVDRAAVDPEGDVFEAEIKANLVNHEEKVHAPTANPTALPGAAIAPVSRVGEPGQKAGCNQVKETKAAKKGGAQQAAMSSPDKPSASTGGVSRKDARWRQMYEELIEYKNNHNGMLPDVTDLSPCLPVFTIYSPCCICTRVDRRFMHRSSWILRESSARLVGRRAAVSHHQSHATTTYALPHLTRSAPSLLQETIQADEGWQTKLHHTRQSQALERRRICLERPRSGMGQAYDGPEAFQGAA